MFVIVDVASIVLNVSLFGKLIFGDTSTAIWNQKILIFAVFLASTALIGITSAGIAFTLKKRE